MWYEITYPFPNFNGVNVEVWEWISNFIPHFTGHGISYPCWDPCVFYLSRSINKVSNLCIAVIYKMFTLSPSLHIETLKIMYNVCSYNNICISRLNVHIDRMQIIVCPKEYVHMLCCVSICCGLVSFKLYVSVLLHLDDVADSSDPQINIDKISIWHKRVRSISNQCWSNGLRYLGSTSEGHG